MNANYEVSLCSWNTTYCHSSTERRRPIIIIMDIGNTVPIHHIDAVVQKCIIIIISFGNLSLYPTTDQHVRRAIKRINPSKSVGLHGIPHLIFNLGVFFYLSLPQ